MKKWVLLGSIPVVLTTLFVVLIAYLSTAILVGSSEPPEMTVSNLLPERVTRWRPHILAEMNRQGLSIDYIDVMLAQLMQESGGNHVDIFQCSESKYGVPGQILTEEESIEQAVNYWIQLLNRAEAIGVEQSDENILQSYNMGIGYLDHLKQKGMNTTEDLASEFSRRVLYGGGDPKYVAHVLRYLEYRVDSELAHVLRTNQYYLGPGQLFGNRVSPIPGRNLNDHNGIDMGAITGTPVYSAIKGVATNHYDPMFGGIEVHVQSGNVMTIYAHLSQSNVSTGQMVDENTVIGLVGSTGASTGPHLHFGWYINGVAVDPVPYLSPLQFTEAFLSDYGY